MTPPGQRQTPAVAEGPEEHLVVLRRLGVLQHQVSQMVASHHQQLLSLQRRLMWQSTRLMLEVTRSDWGLVRSAGVRAVGSGTPRVVTWEAQSVICRTGCAMDAYHWRDGEHCRLLGGPCGHADDADATGALPHPAGAPLPTGG